MSDDLWAVDPGRGMGVLELGQPRREVLRSLQEAGISIEQEDFDEEGEDAEWFFADDMDTVLKFTRSHTPLLREISVEDARLHFGSLPVIGKRLHEIVDLLQVPDHETLWRMESDDPDDRPIGRRASESPSDAELLDGGTLWITTLGLGLGMVRGEITTVHLRRPEDCPRQGVGHITPTQRTLSARPDLPSYLLRNPDRPRPPLILRLLRLAVFAALGAIVFQAVNYQQRWNNAPTAEGTVIAVEPPPPAPFPDEYTVAYRDAAGRQHQAVLLPADVYSVRSIGDKIEIRYLPEAPDRPMGPARIGDAAFVKYMPWGAGVVAVYLVLRLALVAAGGSWRRTAI